MRPRRNSKQRPGHADTGRTGDQAPDPNGVHRARWFWPALLVICVLGGLIRLSILFDYLAENPLAHAPRVDALTYWNWAGRIAAGQWRESTPFFSAPLYPYVLGLLRACGAGLATVYVLQILANLLTAALLGWIGRARFSTAVGLIAPGLFLCMTEPASFCLRILTSSLQLVLICIAWIALLRVQERWSRPRRWVAGGCLGLLSLAYPPAMALLFGLGMWLWWNSDRRLGSYGRAVTTILAGAVVIAPTIVHNYLTSGAFFPIQSMQGITLRHGNAPGAQGVFVAIPGTSIDRENLHPSVQRAFERSTGRRGSWKEIDRYYRNQALAYWRSDPWRASKLFARKAYWFLTGRNYADIYNPELEIAGGLMDRLKLAPVRTAWLIPSALVAMGVLLRRPNKYAPELALFGIPLMIVIVFWFSPRYRFPATPVIVVCSAWAFWNAARWRTRARWSWAVCASLILAVGLNVLNRGVGFDSLGPYRAQFEHSVGVALAEMGRQEQAVQRFRNALQLDSVFGAAESSLGDSLRQLGKLDEAIDHARRAVRLNPRDSAFHIGLGIALMEQRQVDEAIEHFRMGVELTPESPECHNCLANALYEKGDLDNAMAHYKVALRANPAMSATHFNFAKLCTHMGRQDAALQHYREAVRFNPGMAWAYYEIAQILFGSGEKEPAIEELRKAQAHAPGNLLFTRALAWHLATTPGEMRDPPAAVALAKQANERTQANDPGVLDVLAAALAANGQFGLAVSVARSGMDLATERGEAELSAEIRDRLRLYESGTPYIQANRRSAAPESSDGR